MTQRKLILFEHSIVNLLLHRTGSLNVLHLPCFDFGDCNPFGETLLLHRVDLLLLKAVDALEVLDEFGLRADFLHLLVDNIVQELFHFVVLLGC